MKTSQDVIAFVRTWMPDLAPTNEATLLSGGLLNYVWRVPARPHSVIVKHAPPYMAANPALPLDPSRILFEAQALALFDTRRNGPLVSLSSDAVRPPELLFRNETMSTVILEDAGEVYDLGIRFRKAAPVDAELGGPLGAFIGGLHRNTHGHSAYARDFHNVSIQRTRQAVQYDAVGTLFEEVGAEDAVALGHRCSRLGRRLLEPGVCLTMGDLWPASLLVVPEGLRVIDWEFVHFGRPFQDIAHLAAHLWMHRHRLPESFDVIHTFWDRFMASYRLALEGTFSHLWNEEAIHDARVHFGAEIMMRATGAFKAGYLYDGLGAEHSTTQEAIRCAARMISQHPPNMAPEALLEAP